MAITVSAPRRSLGKVAPSSGRAYDDLAAKYADTFRKAQEQQDENQVNEMILRWQKGEVSYEELKAFLEGKIADSPEGSSKKINYMSLLQKAEVTYKKMFENEQVVKVDKKRAELLEKYQEGGVSPQEELSIVQELKKVADSDSEVYRNLITEEAQIRTTIAEKGAASGSKSAALELGKQLDEVKTDMLLNLVDYQNGSISGAELEQGTIQSTKEINELLTQTANAGVSLSAEDFTAFDPYLGKNAPLDTVSSGAEQRLNLRQSGMLLDVVDRAGNITPVTLTQIQNDVIQNPSNPQYQRAPYVALQDPTTGGWGLADSSTGEFVSKELGLKTDTPFTSSQQAEAYAKQQSPGYQLTVRSDNGIENWSYDPETGAFSPQSDPTQKFMSVPTSGKERTLFAYQRPEGVTDEQFNELIKQGQQKFFESGGLTSSPILNFETPKFGPEVEPSFASKFMETPVGKFVGDRINPKAGETEQKIFGVQPGESSIGYLGRKFQPFVEPAKQFVTNLFKPNEGKISSPGFGLNIPDVNIAGFKLPSFSGIFDSFKSPTFANQSQVSSPSSGGPTMQPSGGFGEKIKSFGQRVVGGIKSLLNI